MTHLISMLYLDCQLSLGVRYISGIVLPAKAALASPSNIGREFIREVELIVDIATMAAPLE